MDNTKTYKSDGSADDLISTDELISLNGVAVSDGQKVQRVKAGFGTDGEHRDVDSDHPFPVSDAAVAAALATLEVTTAVVASNTAIVAELPEITDDTVDADLVASPRPHDGSEPITLVALHPDYPLPLDPGQTIVVGGKTASGQTMPQKADALGAQVLSDAPAMIAGTASNASGNSVVLWADTQGYQSLSVQLRGSWVGTVSFYCSNDNSQWDAIAGWPASGAATPITSATANNSWIFPTIGRYFKAQVTAYTSGAVVGTAFLRNQPIPFLASTPAVAANVAQISGTAPVIAGVNGMQAVGGNIAPGGTPTAYPLLVAGVDANTKIRRLSTDDKGAAVVTGQINNNVPVSVRSQQSTSAEDGISDALNQLVRELRYTNHLLQQLPLYLNNGLSQMDEGDRFRGDPTLPN